MTKGFGSSDGTFGARQPDSRPVLRWMNRFAAFLIRRRSGKIMTVDALVLTTVGRKSGALRSTPVGYFADGPDSWLIVASAAGAPKNPAWYHNLAANPDRVEIEIGHERIAVSAEQLRGTERDAAWHKISHMTPQFNKYQQQTDRVIPIIRLTRSPRDPY